MTATAPTSWVPRGRGLTVADLALAPVDGNRYELLDGAVVVTPAPVPSHQRIMLNLAVLLRGGCPDELEVFVAPLDVRLGDDTSFQPDVLVVRRADLTDAGLSAAPVLAVEVLSPSTRTLDLHSKRERLRRAGCPSYWVLDPADGHLIAWDLDEHGSFVQVADLTAHETWESVLPYPVVLTPATLLGR